MLETAYYQVLRIDGDYAILQRLNEPDAEEILVARALLPDEIRDGTKLVRELLEYSIME